MSRQEIRRAVREINRFGDTAESAKRTVIATMTQMRQAASGWLEWIETIEREDPEAARFGILIHSANFPRQVNGCIAPGLGMGWIQGELGVSASRDALRMLFKELGPGDRLVVRWSDY